VSYRLERVVGRDVELGILDGLLEGVGSGPSMLLVSGEAGIGKSTLWEAGIERSVERSWHVLSCRPVGVEARLSYAGLGDLLSGVLEDALPTLPVPQRRALEVALLLAEPNASPLDVRAVGLGLRGVLGTLASVGPVLVAIDDFQWLDVPTARALQFAARRLGQEPISILVSWRLGEGVPVALDELLPPERVVRLEVGPLSRGALARVVRSQVAEAFTRATLVRLHEASGGNPFFALEIARALRRLGTEPAPGEPLLVPENLSDLVRERLDSLPAGTGAALVAAAALSRPTPALIKRLTGSGSSLRAAVQAGVIELEGEWIRFTHPLLASVVYSTATVNQRRRLHRKLAILVDDPEERARHLGLATEVHDEEVAAALEEAGRLARARGAPETAAELAEQAWRLTSPLHTDDRARRKVEAAESHLQTGDLARARVLLEQATSTLPPGPVRARGLVALALVQAHEASRWEESFATEEQALREVGEDNRLRAEIERQLGWSYAASRQALRAEPHARVALELAERLEDRVLLAEALAAYASVEFQRGRGFRRDLIERALALDTLYEHPRVFRHPNWPFHMLLRWTGDHVGARSSLETLLRVALERGEENAPPWLLGHLSEVELEAGNWAAALRLAEEAYALAVDTGQDAPRRNALMARADVEAHQGKTEAARAVAEEQLETGSETGRIGSRALLGFIELSLENAAAAARYLTPLLRDARRAGVEDPSVYPFWPDAIEALIACGELERAESVLGWLEKCGRTLDRPWALATAARSRGLLAAGRGDLDAALAAFGAALREHERLAMPFELARTLLALGAVRRRANRKRAARETLQKALELFEQLGAQLWADRARAELGRVSGRQPAGGKLTEGERRVAELIVRGRTNREAAAELFLSERTVEGHLSHIYAKLGVRSRVELARRLASSPVKSG
jgi:DNA-binding CsgD family transcriptional regulator